MKINFLRIFPVKRKKLRASVARRPLRIAATAEYDEMAEPNMKLSRALLIVLVLHVVAVSGIIAFNAIKTRQVSIPEVAPSAISSSNAPISAAKPEASVLRATPNQKEGRPSRSAPKPVDHAKGSAAGPADSGKVYVVAKGDNPVTIAKKLKVSYDDLLALNHIDDPRKLQIGQKLLIPGKTTKARKSDE